MRIVVVGSSGLLGRKIYDVLAQDHEVGGFYFSNPVKGHKQLDITKYKEVLKAFNYLDPDVIIHTAALCDADFCENNKLAAKKVNVKGTHNIVKICKQKKAKLIFISSDYLFDGNSSPYFEDSDPHPINYYGQTKLEGERIVREELNNFAIIRPSILYGFNDENDKLTFVSSTLDSIRKSKQVDTDGCIKKYPLLIDDLAQFIATIIAKDKRGIFHIKGGSRSSRYRWALEIADIFGGDSKLIRKVKPLNTATKPFDVNLETTHKDLQKFRTVNIRKGTKIFKMQRGCIFKLLYSAHPEDTVMDQSVSRFRIKAGKALASEHPVNADIIVPVPESGIFPATGYAQKLRKPLEFGIVRDYLTKRTLFTSSLKARLSMIESKLVPIPDLLKDKKIVLIDEAILSGSTLKFLTRKIREADASEIHIRIPSPQIYQSCYARMHPDKIELIYSKYKRTRKKVLYEEFLADYFAVESVAFLSLDSIKKAVDNRLEDRCFYCFGGKEHWY